MSRRLLVILVLGLSVSSASGVLIYRTMQSARRADEAQRTSQAAFQHLQLLADSLNGASKERLALDAANSNATRDEYRAALGRLRLQIDELRPFLQKDGAGTEQLSELREYIDNEQNELTGGVKSRTSGSEPAVPNGQDKSTEAFSGLSQIVSLLREAWSLSLSGNDLPASVLRSHKLLARLLAFQSLALILLVYFAHRDASLRTRAAFEVLQTNLRVNAILATMGEGLYQVDLQGRLLYLNPAGEGLLGYKSETILGQPVHDLVHGPNRDVPCNIENCPLLKALTNRELHKHCVDIFVRSDGVSIPVEYTCSPLTYFGDRRGTVLIFRDISERRQMEGALRDSEERYRTLVEKSRGLICTHSLDGTFISVNEASANAVGYSVNELVGTNLRELLAPVFRPKLDWYLKAISEWGTHSGFMRVVTKEGNELVWAYSNRLIHEPGKAPYVLGNAHDVTAQILAEEELKSNGDKLEMALQAERRNARLDFLTGIPNRRTFYEGVESEAHRARRYSRPLTLAYIDVDNFKSMNDLFGHARGDEVLKHVADTIHANIRRTDTAARLGGDEFAILLPETDSRAADKVVSKIRVCLERESSDRAWPISFSIGVVTFERPLDSTQEMINKADELMYEVKRQGKNSVLLITNSV